jgi:hypothetical protein
MSKSIESTIKHFSVEVMAEEAATDNRTTSAELATFLFLCSSVAVSFHVDVRDSCDTGDFFSSVSGKTLVVFRQETRSSDAG